MLRLQGESMFELAVAVVGRADKRSRDSMYITFPDMLEEFLHTVSWQIVNLVY